ncbi:molybdenum cofactor guanylyltransferase [Lacimicrobium sp. SS2-24]|uniref:molybdenum cofactor guanylyltransferase n=1 Tax=Lacimicrobium sp. SS2-24 TaxID=2005569 RepID=UPI000B4B0248|nr:molybdenum cofactor guanylyltransferase [Lacimicrobium sp. SS2-24]
MQLSAVILAGGQSRRMGTDKATLVLEGKTLLEHCVEQVEISGCDRIRISRNLPGYLQDQINNAGPLAGVDAAVHHLSYGELLLVVPIDMPLLGAELLSELINYSHQHQCSCYFEERYLPACVLVTEELKQGLARQLSADGDGSVRGLLAHVQAHALPCNKHQQLQNVNTPEQWQALLADMHSAQQAQSLPFESDEQP